MARKSKDTVQAAYDLAAVEASGRTEDNSIVTMTKARAEKYIRAWNSGMESAYEALYELYTGNAYKVMGFANWAEFCTNTLKGVNGESTARRLAAMVTNHVQTLHALPAGSSAKTILDRMPDRALHQLRDLPAETRAEVVEHFNAMSVVPSELQTLQFLDEVGLITDKQRKVFANMLAAAGGTDESGTGDIVAATPRTLAYNSVQIIYAELNRLVKNHDGIRELGFEDYYDLLRREFNLVPAYGAVNEHDGAALTEDDVYAEGREEAETYEGEEYAEEEA